MKAINLVCNSNANPLGVDNLSPKLSWKLRSNQKETNQSAYQIQVATSKHGLSNADSLMWNTGKVASSDSILISYAGTALVSAHCYYWRVRAWNQDDEPSEWSEIAFWQMGLLSPADWGTAKWIGLEKQSPKDKLVPGLFFKFLPEGFDRKIGDNKLPQFRKSITVAKEVERASIFISGLGHFELLLNGTKVSENFLKQGWTNYEKTIFYTTYDITDQVMQGENVLGAMLGNGMYNVPNERYFMLLTSFGYPKLVAKIVIEYADGEVEEIGTDASWKTIESPITYSSIFGGEGYDTNLEHTEWSSPSYNDHQWRASLIIGEPTARLQSETQPALEANHVLKATSICEIKPDVWVYDFRQNFSGIPSLGVIAEGKHQILITPAELVNEDGSINTENMWGEHYYQYTTRGNGSEKWQPQFSYYGFRYLQVEGAVPEGKPNPKNLPIITQLQGLFVTNKASENGSFRSSNSMINNIHSLIKWAMRSNYASVMTDCPHREKLGWIEQAHLMAPSYQFEYGSHSFFLKIIKDMSDAQADDGLIPCIAPEYTQFSPQYRESPEWGGAYILLPLEVYRFYGDTGVLRTHYEGMEKYLVYLESRSENHLLDIGIGDWMDLGDNPPGPSQLTPTDLVDTALFFQCASTMQKVSEVLNYQEDALIFKYLAENIKKAFNAKYYRSEEASYATGSQTALAMPLYLGLVPEGEEQEVLQSLITTLEKSNYQLTSGDIGHRYLLKTLEKHGLSDAIYRMHTNPDQPSYAYQIAQGATALTESWQASRTASHNHCMLGHLMEWFYTGLAGIGQEEGSCGYKNLVINPQIVEEIGSVVVCFESPYGSIDVSWECLENTLNLKVSIPPNTSAKIYLPSDEPHSITMNSEQLNDSSSITPIEIINRRAVVEVLSGTYLFTCKS